MLLVTGGKVVIDGVGPKKIVASEIAAYGITRTFQEVRLFNQLSVLDNMLVVLTERNVFGALFKKHNALHLKRAEELLRKINLWEKRNEQAGNLSYGQRKLLEIARVMSMDVALYLSDEPFAGLFLEMVKNVVAILKELRVEEKTIVLIVHRAYILDKGKVVKEGEPEKLMNTGILEKVFLGELE